MSATPDPAPLRYLYECPCCAALFEGTGEPEQTCPVCLLRRGRREAGEEGGV
jgi:rubrerythrin